MRLLPSLLPLLVVAALSLAACETDDGLPPAEDCPPDNVLTWESFGEPYTLTWCTPCHSSTLSANLRQGASIGVDFDSYDAVGAQLPEIYARAGGDSPSMPPGGGPTAEDQQMLNEWIACGAP